jgi:xanthine dehydrogenase iron-sulfur cluster and FAD-binding subunit A
VRRALSGHLCRCTGYENIVRAAMAALAQGGASHGSR